MVLKFVGVSIHQEYGPFKFIIYVILVLKHGSLEMTLIVAISRCLAYEKGKGWEEVLLPVSTLPSLAPLVWGPTCKGSSGSGDSSSS